MRETLWQKWCKHYRSGGIFYAIYRGIKYLVWRIRLLAMDEEVRRRYI